jgi:hypothetical protein
LIIGDGFESRAMPMALLLLPAAAGGWGAGERVKAGVIRQILSPARIAAMSRVIRKD